LFHFINFAGKNPEPGAELGTNFTSESIEKLNKLVDTRHVTVSATYRQSWSDDCFILFRQQARSRSV
jgi:hypothetical protein